MAFEIKEYMGIFSNRQRKQAKLGYLSQALFERQFFKRTRLLD
jgi:hypothetical protein